MGNKTTGTVRKSAVGFHQHRFISAAHPPPERIAHQLRSSTVSTSRTKLR